MCARLHGTVHTRAVSRTPVCLRQFELNTQASRALLSSALTSQRYFLCSHHPSNLYQNSRLTGIPSFTLAPPGHSISVLAPYRHPELYARTIWALQLKVHALRACRASGSHYPSIPSLRPALSGHSSSGLTPYRHPEFDIFPNPTTQLYARALRASRASRLP